jgi:hypothetical protein
LPEIDRAVENATPVQGQAPKVSSGERYRRLSCYMPVELALEPEVTAPVLRAVYRLVYTSKRWKLVSFLFAAMIVKTGVWCMPNISSYRQIAQWPFFNPLVPDAHYLFWSWLGPFLAWALRAEGPVSFFLLHLLFSLAFTALFVLVAFSRLEEEYARTSLVMFFVLPVSGTAYFWVGGDSLTLLLMMAALAVSRSLPATLLAGVALGMQHFEQGFLATGALLLAMSWNRLQHRATILEYSIRWAATLLAGVIAGKVVLVGIFRHAHIAVNSGRAFWMHAHFYWLLGRFQNHFQVILYSILGVGWVLVIKNAECGRKALPFLVALSGLLLLLLVTGDHTRVGAIVTFPLLAVYLLLNREYLYSVAAPMVCWIVVAWLVIPYVWVWGGLPKWSVFPYDVTLLLHKAFGWFKIPPDLAMWPFSKG